MHFAQLHTICRILWDAQAPICEHSLLTCASGSLNCVPLLEKRFLSLFTPLLMAFEPSARLSFITSLSGRLSLLWITVSTTGVGGSYRGRYMHFARLRICRTLWDAQAPTREHPLLTCASGSLNCAIPGKMFPVSVQSFIDGRM